MMTVRIFASVTKTTVAFLDDDLDVPAGHPDVGALLEVE